MKTNLNRFIFAAGFSLAVAAMSGNVIAEVKLAQEVIDARQETQIWTTYALSPNLRAHNLRVSVYNGKAILTGTVEEDVNRELAREIALGVSGINDVENNITVKPGQVPTRSNTEKRSYGQVVDDATITAVVKSKLLWSKSSNGMSTDVDTNLGHVTLQGMADNGAARELAGRLAKNTRGVIAVNNQLTVRNDQKTATMDSEKISVHAIGENISDGWITTKVKSMFIYSSNVDSADTSVSTNNGIVTLSGKVGSGAERELVIELAQNVRGVRSVRSENLTF